MINTDLIDTTDPTTTAPNPDDAQRAYEARIEADRERDRLKNADPEALRKRDAAHAKNATDTDMTKRMADAALAQSPQVTAARLSAEAAERRAAIGSAPIAHYRAAVATADDEVRAAEAALDPTDAATETRVVEAHRGVAAAKTLLRAMQNKVKADAGK